MQVLSMTGEYALLAMVHLALNQGTSKSNRKTILTVEEISRATGIPMNFLSKIVISLGKADLVRSLRGRKGGCTLSRNSEKISALEVI